MPGTEIETWYTFLFFHKVKVLVTQLCPTLMLWTVACQAPLSMEFFRQAYWSRLSFPSPGESSQSRDQTPVSHFAGRFFTIRVTREDHSSTRLLSCPLYARNIRDQGQEKLRAGPMSQGKPGSTQVHLNPELAVFSHLWPTVFQKISKLILPAYFCTFLLPLSQNTFATIFHKVMHSVTSFILYLLKRE